MSLGEQNAPTRVSELVISITANFTAEPLGEVLRFWLARLRLVPARLEFPPYNQVFQELIAPDSLLASAVPGLNLLLIRAEDWARDQAPTQRAEASTAAVKEFLGLLTAFAQKARRPTILCLCPPSRQASADPEMAGALAELSEQMRKAATLLPGIAVLTAEDVAARYPVDIIDDPENDRQAHIPFSPAYWTALGTALIRKARTLLQPPRKVIAVDADNTLWGGVVGEVGAGGLRISGEFLELQKSLLISKNQGMLLALVSKNDEADVAQAFERGDMLLKRADFAGWKINWEPKSQNLARLARDLELGLDSFIFLDDNPVECAEVAANCPAVTTLLLPDPSRITQFLRHVWLFDIQGGTRVDAKRTELYRQQGERAQFRDAAATFREFIEGLQLQVEIIPLSPSNHERAAQLTQRTNQFNTSGIRRTTAELASLLSSGLDSGERRALLIRARDRFGDYGEVGLAVFFVSGGSLHVDTLLLSCRVLGKGVEHRFLAELGRQARKLDARDLVIAFKPTDRNQPARKFLDSVGAQFQNDSSYHMTTAAAEAVVFDPEQFSHSETSADNVEEQASGPQKVDFLEIATELDSAGKIMRAVSRYLRRARPKLANEWVEARSSNEARLVQIWEDVLHVEPVGITDPFLSLGGQSLQAASVASRISGEFGVRVPLSFLLSNPTIIELSDRIAASAQTETVKLRRATGLSLSSAQQRLWFLDQFIPNRAAYNIPVARRIHGKLDTKILAEALSRVVLRHDALRATFAVGDESDTLRISAAPDLHFQCVSVTSESEAISIANDQARQPFDLATGPLLRCLAISWGTEDDLLVLNVHHIVSDGWSTGILLRELADAYEDVSAARDSSWASLTASYADYAAWQRERTASGEFEAELAYWKQELQGAPSLLEIAADKARPSEMTYTGSITCGTISAEARHALEALAASEKSTPFALLLAVWQVLLHRYSRQDDIIVGVPVAGRNHTSLEGLVGVFVNTLPIRTQVDPDASFLSFLQTVREKLSGALAHQDLPFEVLVTELGLGRDLSRSPLFQVMLVLQDTPKGDFAPAGIEARPIPLHNGGAKFDLVLEVTPAAEGFGLTLEFNTSLFLPETAERMLRHFTHLLEQACASPQTSISRLPLMNDAELKQTLSFVNTNSAVFDDVECLHHWFERVAAATPDRPALTYEGRTLSYGELNQRANRIAHYLIGCGIGPDVLVGICMERSENLVTAILGILKAGGAYLPIDLSYPTDRLAFMLSDAQAAVLLTERKLAASLPTHQARVVFLDDDDEEAALAMQPVSNPVTGVAPEHMAYVIYTSGSTGQPKGCMVMHKNVSRLLRATERWFEFGSSDVWTLFHSCAFDFSVWEIWGALLYGGRVVVVPFMVSRSPEAFYELLANEHVTVLNQTPSAFRQLIQAEESVGEKELSLRYVIFGGEALEMQSLRPWFARHGDQKPRLVNMYGITETTVHVTYRPLSMNDLHSGSVIGVPIPDLQIYVVDQLRQPVPIGVPGEMYVGGAGLARGYLNRPELTAERFIPDHLTMQPGARLYRTGDLARLLPRRDIEYLGRIDQQVKIRGFRIELGEIEAVLGQHPAVRESAVVAREDVPGTKRLVAYLVTSQLTAQLASQLTAQPGPDVNELREFLKKKLPEYMVPAAFIFLEKLPLTTNGKVDRKALPVPEQQRPELGKIYVAPRTVAEQKLAEIWSKVLRISKIGTNDNFFELGGDSILSIQIISIARREGLKLTPKQLFANQTIAELAAVAGVAEDRQDSAEIVAGNVPLTPIQNWFFEQQLAEPHHYNQSFLFELSERLERGPLELAIKGLAKHHDALRMRYLREAGGFRQLCAMPDGAVPLSWIDLASMKKADQRRHIETEAAVAQASLNLAQGPIFRIAYFDLGPDAQPRLLFIVHHLVVDGISWRPLLEDLETAYRQLKTGQPVRLPGKTTSYLAWAQKLQDFASTDVLRKQTAYWESVSDPQLLAEASKASAESSLGNLPGYNAAHDMAEDASQNTEGSSVTLKISLTSEETAALLQQVPAVYNTQINDVLLTAMLLGWNRSTGSRILFTNLEGHGRENLFEDADLSRTSGWFTSIFPVRLELPQLEKELSPGETLKSVKEQLREVPQRGIGYGILRYLTDNTTLANRAEPSMVFNYLGQFDQVVADSNLFRFADESEGPWHSPRQRRRYLLEINSLAISGKLEFRWTYNPHLQQQSTIENLANEFLSALKELIVHCRQPNAGGRTPSDFPLARLDQATLDRLVSEHRDLEDVYPLSPIQTLFFSANPGAAHLTFDQWQCTLRGDLNVPAFRRAWDETVRRHTILRSTIHGEGLREPLQIVHRDTRLPWTIEDWRGSSSDARTRWNAFLETDRAQPLMLTQAPAMRFALVRLADETWKFLWSVPALLLDGWSWPVVFRDASRLYEAYSAERTPQLESVRPYRDYIEWLSTQSAAESENFWRENLAGFREPTPLLRELANTAGIGNGSGKQHERQSLRLSEDATNALQTLARRLQLTLSTLVQGVWALLLDRQTRAGDIVFGAAFAGRPADLRGVESIVGPFVNNLPIRVRVQKETTAGDFFRRLHSSLLQVSPYQFTPLMEIQRSSEVPWRHRLFESLVVFQNYLVDESAQRFGRSITIDDFAGPIHSNYPVMLLAEPGATLRLTLIYDRLTVAETVVRRWMGDLGTLFELLPAMVDRDVADLQERLSSPEREMMRGQAPPKLRVSAQNFVPAQTEVERSIAGVWQTMFGLEKVSIEENFFDLGGQSLLLVQMHGLLREKLNIEFPIVKLFEHPTVRSLARHLDQGTSAIPEPDASRRERADRQKKALAQMRVRLKK